MTKSAGTSSKSASACSWRRVESWQNVLACLNASIRSRPFRQRVIDEARKRREMTSHSFRKTPPGLRVSGWDCRILRQHQQPLPLDAVLPIRHAGGVGRIGFDPVLCDGGMQGGPLCHDAGWPDIDPSGTRRRCPDPRAGPSWGSCCRIHDRSQGLGHAVTQQIIARAPSCSLGRHCVVRSSRRTRLEVRRP